MNTDKRPNIPMLVKRYGVCTSRTESASSQGFFGGWEASMERDGRKFTSRGHNSKRSAVLAVLDHFKLPIE